VSKTGGSEKMSLFLHEHGTSAVQCSAVLFFVCVSIYFLHFSVHVSACVKNRFLVISKLPYVINTVG
jgi:hypothetical protein